MREHITRLLPATASWLFLTVAHLPAPENFSSPQPDAIAELIDLEDWNWLEDSDLFGETIASNKLSTEKENFLLSPNPSYPSVGISHQNSAVYAPPVANEGYSLVMDPYHITTLSAELPAMIIKITKKIGDSIELGELLIEQDSRVYVATYEKAAAAIQKAQTVLDGQMQLYRDGLASLFDLKDAEASLATAMADLAIAKKALDSTKTFAPYNGKVLTLFAEEFELPRNSRNDNREMIQIIDDHILLGRVLLPSHLFGKVRLGQKVAVHVKETGTTVSGEITRIAAIIDPASSTIKVEMEIDNREGKLLSGMSGTAIIEAPAPADETMTPFPEIEENFFEPQERSNTPGFEEKKALNFSSSAEVDFKTMTADDFGPNNSFNTLKKVDVLEDLKEYDLDNAEESSFFIGVLDAIEAAATPKEKAFTTEDFDIESPMDQEYGDIDAPAYQEFSDIEEPIIDQEYCDFSIEDFDLGSPVKEEKDPDSDATDLMTLLGLDLSKEADLWSDELPESLDFSDDDMIMNSEDPL